jgi:hypothetical protein
MMQIPDLSMRAVIAPGSLLISRRRLVEMTFVAWHLEQLKQ